MKNIFKVSATCVMIFMAALVFGQGPNGNGGGQGQQAPSSGAPIDGGVISLVVGSAYFAYKKLHKDGSAERK